MTSFVASSLVVAEDQGCEEMLGFATSAVRDAVNSHDVLATVEKRTDVDIRVLSGEDEARLTFLAVRRWFGWSAGRLVVFDIGGGSLEIAGGADEAPDVAWSLPLGAARLSRQWLTGEPLDDEGWPATRAPCSGPAPLIGPSRRRRPSARWPGSAAPRVRARVRSCRARCPPTRSPTGCRGC